MMHDYELLCDLAQEAPDCIHWSGTWAGLNVPEMLGNGLTEIEALYHWVDTAVTQLDWEPDGLEVFQAAYYDLMEGPEYSDVVDRFCNIAISVVNDIAKYMIDLAD